MTVPPKQRRRYPKKKKKKRQRQEWKTMRPSRRSQARPSPAHGILPTSRDPHFASPFLPLRGSTPPPSRNAQPQARVWRSTKSLARSRFPFFLGTGRRRAPRPRPSPAAGKLPRPPRFSAFRSLASVSPRVFTSIPRFADLFRRHGLGNFTINRPPLDWVITLLQIAPPTPARLR